MSDLIGISAPKRTKIIEKLSVLLADSVVLYVKTQGFHWNVTGPHFVEYHTMFQAQYTDLAIAIDDIAERIRALGGFPPAGLGAFQKLSVLSDSTDVPKANDMINALLKDHEKIAETADTVITAARDGNDDVTEDLMIGRRAVHHKTAWMLRAILAA